MSVFQKTIERQTDGRGAYSFGDDVQAVVAQSGVAVGICQVFVHHTSASLILSENADPDVQRDLETFMSRLVPDGDPIYRHTMEGPDDMPAHVRAMLTQSAISLPVREGRCDLGTWQGIYLWEHRHTGYQRRVTVTVIGD
jgi:secondary thiamine-phosphate synthase enzyme